LVKTPGTKKNRPRLQVSSRQGRINPGLPREREKPYWGPNLCIKPWAKTSVKSVENTTLESQTCNVRKRCLLSMERRRNNDGENPVISLREGPGEIKEEIFIK